MKAVIVGVRGRYAAALTEEGRVTRIRNREYSLGQQIENAALQEVSPLKKAAGWAVAAAVAIAVCAGGAYMYVSPYAYVSLDVNPAVEYVLNRFDRVIHVYAVNDDASRILEGVQLTNKSIDAAVRETLNCIASSGYFEDTKQNGLLIGTSCQNEQASEKLALRLEQSAQEETSNLHAEVKVATVTVSQEYVEEARNLGVTTGKLALVEQLKESAENPDSINIQEWVSQPVVEIMNEITASKEEGPPQTSSGESESSMPESDPGENSTGISSETIPESAEPSVEPSQPEESLWEEPSEMEESSAESSDGTSELADVSEPKGKPVDKQQNSEKRKEGMDGPASKSTADSASVSAQ